MNAKTVLALAATALLGPLARGLPPATPAAESPAVKAARQEVATAARLLAKEQRFLSRNLWSNLANAKKRLDDANRALAALLGNKPDAGTGPITTSGPDGIVLLGIKHGGR